VSCPEDLHRKYVERALNTALEYRSYQTGFVHVHPDLYKGRFVQVAPTYENVLFVLLLFRKKSVDHVKQARILLERLLGFQQVTESEQKGNFPFFLTEYPSCRDRYLPFRLLPLFNVMIEDCAPLLGKKLCSLLQKAEEDLSDAAEEIVQSMKLPAWAKVMLALKKGEEVLRNAWSDFIDSKEWMNPSLLGTLLSSLQSTSLFQECLDRAQSLWGKKTYRGPALDVFQFGGSPEITIFDCLMSLYTSTALEKRQWPYLTALEYARVSPSKVPLLRTQKQWYSSKEWCIESVGQSTLSCAFFTPPSHSRAGFCPARIVMPRGTLSLDFPRGKVVALSQRDGRWLLRVKIEEAQTLLKAYVEKSEMGDFISDLGGTVFDPFKGVRIGDITLGLCRTEIETIGIVSMGDRPQQRLQKNRGNDWQIDFECLRGEIPETLTFWIEP